MDKPPITLTVDLPTRIEIWSDIAAQQAVNRDNGNIPQADFLRDTLLGYGWTPSPEYRREIGLK